MHNNSAALATHSYNNSYTVCYCKHYLWAAYELDQAFVCKAAQLFVAWGEKKIFKINN